MLKFLPLLLRNARRGRTRTFLTASGVAVSLLVFTTLRAADAGMRQLYERAGEGGILVVFQEGRY